jgi:DNA-binding XRE family transcriptional regulator
VTDRQILRIVGENVKAARVKAELTQECLAELADVHWQTISNIENGKFPFPVTTFIRICQAIGISAERLLDRLPQPDHERIEKTKKAMARKRKPKMP